MGKKRMQLIFNIIKNILVFVYSIIFTIYKFPFLLLIFIKNIKFNNLKNGYRKII